MKQEVWRDFYFIYFRSYFASNEATKLGQAAYFTDIKVKRFQILPAIFHWISFILLESLNLTEITIVFSEIKRNCWIILMIWNKFCLRIYGSFHQLRLGSISNYINQAHSDDRSLVHSKNYKKLNLSIKSFEVMPMVHQLYSYTHFLLPYFSILSLLSAYMTMLTRKQFW